MASFLSTCGEADFFDKLEYLKLLKETWMLNENVPLPSNSENKTEVDNGFVHTVVVETGPDIPKQSEVMNEQNEDLKTINPNY